MDDSFTLTIHLADERPVFDIDDQALLEELTEHLWRQNEERTCFDDGEPIFQRAKKALAESLDVEKFKEAIPRAFYANGKEATITKQDLVDYFNTKNLKQ